MAGLTPTPLAEFRRLLRARGSSLEQLAAEIGTGRPCLSQVLWGYFASPDTWARIHAVVTPQEWEQLSHVEHCPAWNNPRPALPWCVRVVCAWCKEEQPFKPVADPCEPGAISHGICPACYAAKMTELEQLAPAVNARARFAAQIKEVVSRGKPEPVRANFAHLVRTEAGLQVHATVNAEPPALADARDFAAGEGVEIETVCRLSVSVPCAPDSLSP